MADSLSDADKIRNKRLAKLGSQAPPQQDANGEGSSSDAAKPQPSPDSNVPAAAVTKDAEPARPKINISRASDSSNGPQNPFSQLGMKGTNGDTPKINITPPAGRPVTPQKRDRPSSIGRPSSRNGETLEQWEDRILGNLFKFDLDPDHQLDIQGQPLYFLKTTREELEETNQPIRLTTALLDQAILEAASNPKPNSTLLDYMLGCWKRVNRQYKLLRKTGEQDPKFIVIKEARRLCMSYCIFAITMPDMFGVEPITRSPLVPHLLIEDPEDERSIDQDFLTEAISRFSEDDSVRDAFVSAVEDLSRELSRMNLNQDYKPYMMSLRHLVQYPEMINVMVQSPLFIPDMVTGDTLSPATIVENSSLLGPFFALSPLADSVPATFFSSPTTRDRSFVQNSQRALRLGLQNHQIDLLDVVNRIVKAGEKPREKMLNWFALCVNTNHKRRALQVDKKLVSSDGFMINVTVCLDQLCEPFMDASFSKINRIDVDYLRRQPRVNIKDETKLNADQTTSDSFYNNPAEGKSNFISEVFFLSLAAHQYGLESVNSMLSTLERELQRMRKHLEEIELDRHKFASDPGRLRIFDEAVKKYKDKVDDDMSYKFAVEGVLLDELTQARSMQYMRYVIVWLLRLVDPSHEFPQKPLKLPLPEEQPEVFKCLPEYYLEIVVSNFKFIMRNMPQIITSTQSDELVMLCITFLRSSEYIKNPYLKSGLVTILFHGTFRTWNRPKGVLGDLLNSLPFATDHLLHALMKFYIEVENTGAHTQFYDKFNIRYEIFQIIKCIWSNPVYRDHLSQEAKVNLDFFVRFVNLLLNDVTFVLDESLTAFMQIHNLQQELKHAGPTMEESVKTEKEEALHAAQGKAKSYMQLTNETVAMLKLFTEALADSFTMPEIVQRLADMLDYNLDNLVGPKQKDLVVENPKEYGFDAKQLLAEIVDVYLNLKDKESFVFAVARDGRSYKPANLEQATRVLKRWSLKSPEELTAWHSLGQKFKKAKELDDQAEEDLGEIPEEFLDPLTYILMEDPVILPKSKTTVERSTIRSHLLSDPTDPFNRSPLKVEDVIPDTNMKDRIQAFKDEKKGSKIAESNVMDETPG